MAISEPRTMPTEGAARQKWRTVDVGYGWREAGGRSGGVGEGTVSPWRMELALGEMSTAAGDAWWAFATWCGIRRTFYAHDILRPYPAAYPAGFAGLNRAGGGAFPADGAPSSWSVDASGEVLTLSGLPAAFVLGVGDWAGWVWDTDKRTAAKVVEGGTANGSGVLVVSIQPPLPAFVPSDAAMTLALCEMVLRLTPETDLGDEDTVSLGGGKIVAEQDLRA